MAEQNRMFGKNFKSGLKLMNSNTLTSVINMLIFGYICQYVNYTAEFNFNIQTSKDCMFNITGLKGYTLFLFSFFFLLYFK